MPRLLACLRGSIGLQLVRRRPSPRRQSQKAHRTLLWPMKSAMTEGSGMSGTNHRVPNTNVAGAGTARYMRILWFFAAEFRFLPEQRFQWTTDWQTSIMSHIVIQGMPLRETCVVAIRGAGLIFGRQENHSESFEEEHFYVHAQ